LLGNESAASEAIINTILKERVKYWNYLRLGNQFFNYQCEALKEKVNELETDIKNKNKVYEKEKEKTKEVTQHLNT
jgi:hypothetical protein